MARGAPVELPADNPITFRVFDKCMACVENIDRGEPQGFKQQCDDDFLLTVSVLLLALFSFAAWLIAAKLLPAGWLRLTPYLIYSACPCLQLRPYQRRSLAHMLREERAPGGAARHLWVKLNLREQPGGWASPASATAAIAAARVVSAHGNAGLLSSKAHAWQTSRHFPNWASRVPAYAPMLPTLQTCTAM